MRLVAVADTHTFEAELGSLPDGDVFIHAGDLLRRGTLEELAGVARWLRGLPHARCDALLAAALRLRPALHLFGHIHEDGGFWREGGTAFANVTTWECERGATVLDVDPVTRSVSEVFVPPAGR